MGEHLADGQLLLPRGAELGPPARHGVVEPDTAALHEQQQAHGCDRLHHGIGVHDRVRRPGSARLVDRPPDEIHDGTTVHHDRERRADLAALRRSPQRTRLPPARTPDRCGPAPPRLRGLPDRGRSAARLASNPFGVGSRGMPASAGGASCSPCRSPASPSCSSSRTPDAHWLHRPTHFWLILLTALVNVVLGLAASEAARRRGDARATLVSLSFLSSAGFLALHALATPGQVVDGANTGFDIATPVGLLIGAGFAAASALELSPPAGGGGAPPRAAAPRRAPDAARRLGGRLPRRDPAARPARRTRGPSRRADRRRDRRLCPLRVRHRALPPPLPAA